jgi:hypothetical protein
MKKGTPAEPRSSSVWTLEKTGSPQLSASAVTAEADLRFSSDGKWVDRHHLLFENVGLQPNTRSYFDRGRETLDTKGGEYMHLEDHHRGGIPYKAKPHAKSTASTKRQKRIKLTEAEKLPVKWKLQDNTKSKKDPNMSLRESQSDGSLQSQNLQQKREGWFGSFGVHF